MSACCTSWKNSSIHSSVPVNFPAKGQSPIITFSLQEENQLMYWNPNAVLSVTKYIFSQSYSENKCPPYLPKAQPCPRDQINCTIYDKPLGLSKYNSLYAQDKGKKGILLLPSSYFTILRTVFLASSRIYPCLFFPSLWKWGTGTKFILCLCPGNDDEERTGLF